MNSPIHAPSPPSSSSSCSYNRPPPCLAHASRNFKFPLLLPQAIRTSQKMYRCSGGHVEGSTNTNPLKNYVVGRSTSGWFETQPLVSEQLLNRRLLPVEALVTPTVQDFSDTPLIGDDKIGVLLLNLGGPETLEDVQPFLFNLFADPDIIRLPRLFSFLQKPLAQFVSVLRAPKSKEGYASIGGGSPLRRITDAQAEELRKSLWSKNVPAKVYVGMRYWHPFTEEAIEQVMIFFSAHGVPLAYVEEAGDPYKAEMEECVDLIMEELEKRKITNAYTLAYQSRVGPVEWLKPYTDETIIELGEKGVKSLLAVPISFVSEHIETLEEIDVEYKELALNSGIEKWGRVPALGTEPTFISDLADAVIESLPYVGAMAVSNLEARQSLVPLGSVEELLAAYDSQRRELPPPVIVWEWGWTKSAETWNGRAAMLAVLLLLFLEVTTGEGFLHQWGILPLFR
ncbi:ferrochelatase-2, chloroplastic-like isoform X2 [Glycine soja]|uniref:Ferrochelatase n=1 Tax=Glycine max TaxID=3847 RepID=K7KRA8_SOYBN|nr:ferrochelatase-2, chloroplastic isoform X2 [Glycine max]XP_028233383.1 ferrochelatase-2, chloroplastic-like isoform X2 [Glycine soja]|eukprot:XP_006580371.1 ferrochelatase-2, chloroplastic-like isoform X2 [Glycine max]